jgi:hypothetical protein
MLDRGNSKSGAAGQTQPTMIDATGLSRVRPPSRLVFETPAFAQTLRPGKRYGAASFPTDILPV